MSGQGDGSARYLRSRPFLRRHALAGNGRFVHKAAAVQNNAVHGKALAGLHHKYVVHAHIFCGNAHFLAVTHDGGRPGGKAYQFGDGFRRFSFGAGLKELAERNQGKDHGRGFEIEMPARDSGRCRVALFQRHAHSQNGPDTGKRGRAGTNGNKGIHIRRAGKKRFKTDTVIFPVHNHDRQRQQKLHKSGRQRMRCGKQGFRQGQTKHVPHGKIHQRHKKAERHQQTPAHGAQFVRQCISPSVGLAASLSCRAVAGLRSVAGLTHGVRNLRRRNGRFVKGHLHAVFQQVDGDLRHPRHLPHGLFHTGRAGGTRHARNGKHRLPHIHTSLQERLNNTARRLPLRRSSPIRGNPGCLQSSF